MAIYGDMLALFPELFQEIEVFSMSPKYGAGYGPRKRELICFGYLSRFNANKEKIQGENRTENKSGTLYTFDPLPSGAINQGWYIEDSGELFQIVNDENYAKEAGMSAYRCQIVTGSTGEQIENKKVTETAINDF